MVPKTSGCGTRIRVLEPRENPEAPEAAFLEAGRPVSGSYYLRFLDPPDTVTVRLQGKRDKEVEEEMGYPERLLSDDEVIESQFRPHWSGILREGLIVLAGIIIVVVLIVFDAPLWSYPVVAGLVILLVTGGVVRWANTLHVITNERLIYRAGFFAKHGTEIPLEVIQNVAFKQSVLERVFGTGDLVIESAGTHGQTRYTDIPNPEGVQSLIYRKRETRMMEVESGGLSSRDNSGVSSASQLEILSRLHDDGKLSDAEFESEKKKLIGGI